MAFDPDAYLATKKASSGFDPDAYLATKKTAPAAPEVSKLESAVRGAGQGLSLGFGDEIAGGIESAFTDKSYTEARDESRANNEKARASNPKTYMGTQVVGSVAPMFIPGAQGVSAAKLAALAGLQGLGESDADLTKGEFGDAAKDTAVSAAMGFAIPKAMQGAGKVLKAAPAAFENVAVNNARRALGYTAADLTKNPKAIREANKVARIMLDEGVITNPLTHPLSSSADDMLARVQALKKVGRGAIESVETKADDAGLQVVNPLRPATELAEKQAKYGTAKAAAPIYNQFETGIDDVLALGDNPKLRDLQNLKNIYKELAFPKGVVTEAKPGVVDSFHSIKREMESAVGDAATKLNDKELLRKYLEGKRVLGASKAAERTLTKEVGRQAGNSPLTLRGTMLAAGEAAAGNPVRAAGAAGVTTVALRQGAQAVATTADAAASIAKKIEKALRVSPQRFGRWAAPLQNAAQRGPSSLATSIFLLQQNEPEFRTHLDELDAEAGE